MGKELELDINEKERHPIRTTFFLAILIITLLILYGFFLGNSGLIIKEYDIESTNIPESFNDVKIAHFSDIIYNNKGDIENIKNVVKKINDKKVDIIVFSGGLLDSNYKINEKETSEITNELKKLNSTYGKYYVSAKDDKESQVYENIMQNSGFTSLNDKYDIIYNKTKESIMILGIDSTSNKLFIRDAIKDKDNMYKIVLFHESDMIEDLEDYNFNLALAGNSLNGQINIPLIKDIFLPNGSKNYYSPYYKVNNTEFYISSGIGTRKIDFRLFNKPSISIYNLENKK